MLIFSDIGEIKRVVIERERRRATGGHPTRKLDRTAPGLSVVLTSGEINLVEAIRP